MAKLKLMLDDLAVASFPVCGAQDAAKGTVLGNEVTFNGCSNYCDTVGGTACATQQQTCVPITK
jgi:hypothetical protein